MTKFVKNIFLIRSMGITEDSRAYRIYEQYGKLGVRLIVLDWPIIRSNCFEHIHSCPIIRKKSKPIVNFFLIPAFMVWVLYKLFDNCRTGDIVHAVDLDTAIPTFIFSIFLKIKIIFDIADPFSLSRIRKKSILLDWAEIKIAENVDLVVLPSLSRKEIYFNNLKKVDKVIVIENVPIVNCFPGPPSVTDFNKSNKIIKLGYCGTLEPRYRGLENLLRLSREIPTCELIVAGVGGLVDEIITETKINNRLKFYGSFNNDDLWFIYQKVDVIVGLYYLEAPLHKWAAPNKYYEHLFAKKPLLTTLGTPPGESVMRNLTGWAIADSYTDLLSWFDAITIEECVDKGNNANLLWNKYYAEYWDVSVKKNLIDAFISQWLVE